MVGSILILLFIAFVVIAYVVGVHVVFNRDEVFQITDNVFDFGEACAVCSKLGARMASSTEVIKASANGASWDNLGWTSCGGAYRPNGTSRAEGGMIPPQVRLGVNCYGIKPAQSALTKQRVHIAPWNSRHWSMHQLPI